jgi:hypothetical protein
MISIPLSGKFFHAFSDTPLLNSVGKTEAGVPGSGVCCVSRAFSVWKNVKKL